MTIVAVLFSVFVSCNSTPSKPETTEGEEKDSIANFFPVHDYLLSEIRHVDSLPVGIMRYTTTGTHTDSGYIKTEEFHQLAQEFLSPEFEETQFVKISKSRPFSIRVQVFILLPMLQGNRICKCKGLM